MRAVHQTNFAFGTGNCLAAAIASLLELPLEAVPNFCEGNNPDWFADLEDWAFGVGLRVTTFPGVGWCEINGEGKWTGEVPEGLKVVVYPGRPRGYSILSGKSPRGPYLHSVVAYNGEVVHDPFPAGGGVETEHDWMIFYPENPATVARGAQPEVAA